MVIDLQKDTFNREVLEADALALVDFYADWCGPCQMLAPHVDALAETYPTLKVCRLNVDDAGEVAARFGITSIPTLIFFRAGQPVKVSVGYLTREQLTKMTEELL